MYDVIVVGARCGGAPTAMLMARKGYKVLLVDRGTFPSDIPNGHLIHRRGPPLLQRWGLLERIVATNCPAITSFIIDLGDFPLVGKNLLVDRVALAYGPRRKSLDKVLVDAAVEAGAELREEFAVEDFTSDGNRITGIRGRDLRGGSLVTEHAAVTVGADGRNSLLARTVRTPAYDVRPAVTFYFFGYWSGVPSRELQIYVRPRHAIFAFPTNDNLFAIFIGWPMTELPTVRADLERQFLAAIDAVPKLAEQVRAGRREERFYGATNLPNFLRQPRGPGWALVGDAGCHKDPFLALGVCDAFRDADLLAEALDDGLAERQPLDAALATYEQRRNRATMPEYEENYQLAQFKPPPEEVRRLRAALRGNQTETNRFIMAREGMIPPETFFNPENIQRIISSAVLSEARLRRPETEAG